MEHLNAFDRIAPLYDLLARAVFGSSIKKAQFHFRDSVPDGARVLIIGGGTGDIAVELHRLKADVEIWFVDASVKMIRYTAKKIAPSPRFHLIHGTHQDLPEEEFNVVITPFFFDLFSDSSIPAVLSCLERVSARESRWIVTDFVNEKWWHAALLKVMYLFFRVCCGLQNNALPDWKAEMRRANETNVLSERSWYAGFIRSAVMMVRQKSKI
jgi:tRNA (cmo5U34)-methyltransferase